MNNLTTRMIDNLSPSRISPSANAVNHTVRDVWIERYLAALERWRIEASDQGIVLAHLRRAWSAYTQYYTSGDPAFRYQAWSAIQKAAAALTRGSLESKPRGRAMPAVTQPRFTHLEGKLVRLLLSPGAQAGEVESAGRALIASWRKRGIKAEELLASGNYPSVVKKPKPSFDAGDFIMPFGKYRGIAIRKIKGTYLRWLLNNCTDLQPELRRAINAVLYD